MKRQTLHAYVFPYPDNGRQRANVYCSQECGNAALAEPPASWDPYRALVTHALRDAIRCDCCGFTIQEVYEQREVGV